MEFLTKTQKNSGGSSRRIIFLILPIIGLAIILSRPIWVVHLDLNKQLVCLLREYYKNGFFAQNSCLDEDEWVLLSQSSLTVNILNHQRNFENGVEPTSAITHVEDCEVEELRSDLLSHQRYPLIRMQNYFDTLAMIQYLHKSVEIDSTCANLFPSSIYYWERARDFEKIGDLDTATVHVEFAYLLDSYWLYKDSRGENALRQAAIYRERTDLDSAEGAYWRAIGHYQQSENEKSPQIMAWAYKDLAEIAESPEERLTLLEKAIESNPITADQMASQFVEEVIITESSKELETFAARHVGDTKIIYAIVSGLIDQGSVDIAQPILAETVRQNGDDPYLNAAQGMLAMANESYSYAAILLEQAVKDLDDDPYNEATFFEVLSKVKVKEGDFASAIAAQEKALKLMPNRKWLWYQLAVLFQQTGNMVDAQQAIETALELDPGNERYLTLLQEITVR